MQGRNNSEQLAWRQSSELYKLAWGSAWLRCAKELCDYHGRTGRRLRSLRKDRILEHDEMRNALSSCLCSKRLGRTYQSRRQTDPAARRQRSLPAILALLPRHRPLLLFHNSKSGLESEPGFLSVGRRRFSECQFAGRTRVFIQNYRSHFKRR